jgi:hypothetical protein
MTARFDPRELTDALRRSREPAGEVVVPPGSASSPATGTEEWQQREAFKVKLISARVKLQLMRDRTDALKEALERFRSQRDAMRA